MSSCDIQTQKKVMSVLNKPEHQNTIAQIQDLVNQIPCERQTGGGLSKGQYAQLLTLVMAIIVAINAVMEIKEIKAAQCDLTTMVMNALAQSQYCTQQSNALNSAISSAVLKVTGAAGLGVTGYLLSEDKKEENQETTGGRKAKKSRKARKSKKSKKAKKAKKVKKTRKARKVRKAKKSRKA
jgi:hypothetical protein